MRKILLIFLLLATAFVGLKIVNFIHDYTTRIPYLERSQTMIELRCSGYSYNLYKPENTIGIYFDEKGNKVTINNKNDCHIFVEKEELIQHPIIDNLML